MKKSMIVLSLVTLSLVANFAGCTSLDKKYTHGKYPDTPSTPGNIKVLTMPPEFEKQLFELAGTNKIFFVTVHDRSGNPVILKSSRIIDKETKFPIATRKILDISSTATVRHEGSECITVVQNGMGRIFCLNDDNW